MNTYQATLSAISCVVIDHNDRRPVRTILFLYEQAPDGGAIMAYGRMEKGFFK